MRRLPILVLAVLLMSACASPRLYYWGSSPTFGNGTSRYEQLAYRFYDQQSPESICALVALYEDMISHPGGKRGVVPPGIYAEYGYLLLQPSTAEAFNTHATKSQRKLFETSSYASFFPQRGKEMLQKEMELYPESAQFIVPLLRRLNN